MFEFDIWIPIHKLIYIQHHNTISNVFEESINENNCENQMGTQL